MVCPEGLPQKMVPPGVVQESLSHQLLSVDPQSEQEPQKPHLLEENGEDVRFGGADVAGSGWPGHVGKR